MKLVVDASAAIGAAQRYESGPLEDALQVLAPDVFIAEVTNAVWKMRQFGGVSTHDAEVMLDRAVRLPDDLISGGALYKEAFALASAARHPAYDMFYIALAKLEHAALFTHDKALRKIARAHHIEIA